MKDVVGTVYLLDFYGSLLTERQYYCMHEHYENDLSLGEIADDLKISRQAVYDNLQRARIALEEYEAKLHLVEQFHKRQEIVERLKNMIGNEIVSSTQIDELLNSL